MENSKKDSLWARLPKIKTKYWIIGAVIIMAAGYYWNKSSSSSEKEVRYVTAEAEKSALASSISTSGSVIIDNQSTVDPTITGTVAGLAVEVGDKVEKGQFLFNIINDDLGVSAAKASASYKQALNSLESAKIDRDSAKASYEKAKEDDDDDGDAYTTRELEVLEDKVKLAKEKINQTEASLSASLLDYRNIQADAAKRKVTAPISGTVQEVNIKNGDDLSRVSGSSSNAQAPIIIGNLETLKCEVEVNEVDISKVSIGQKAIIKLDALEDMDFSGQVEKIDSLGTVTQGVVSYNVTITFDSISEKIKPDMSVAASIITDVKSDVLSIPSGAIKNEGNSFYVEILSNGKAEKKPVETGISNDTNTEIVAGLSVGEKIITQTIDSDATASSRSSGNNVRVPGIGGFGR